MIRRFFFIAAALILVACEVPDDAPVGAGLPSAIPSEAPASDEPPCFQQLQCIIDNTTDNALRKTTQEAINDLFLLDEPQYTDFCQNKAQELAIREPSCERS